MFVVLNLNLADMLSSLVEQGKVSNVDSSDEHGNTLLMLAATGANAKMITVMLNKNADVQLKNNSGGTVLHVLLASGGDRDHIKEALEVLLTVPGISHIINTMTNEGMTALMLAVSLDDVRIMSLLLENNADVRLANKRGSTALHVLLLNGEGESADSIITKLKRLLTAPGVEEVLNSTNHDCLTPLEISYQQSEPEWFKLIVKAATNLSLPYGAVTLRRFTPARNVFKKSQINPTRSN